MVWWSAIGAMFVALQVYVLGSWLASGDFAASPKGADPVPGSHHLLVMALQILSPLMFLVAIAYVVRQSRREGQVSFDALFLIAWVSMAWQDPIVNYIRPTFFYSADFVNIGSWTEHIPGWISPNGRLLPEPVFFTVPTYGYLVFVTILSSAVMRYAKTRWPRLGTAGIIATGFTVMTVFDVLFECAFIRTGALSYPGAVHGLSIWGGETYQFPIYQAVLWSGTMWTATGALRYFRDDKGRSVVERGVDTLQRGRSVRVILRGLALCGFVNVCMLAYNIAFSWFALHVDQTPAYPSYRRAGICGPGTAYDCPGPSVPIPLPQSPPPRTAFRETPS